MDKFRIVADLVSRMNSITSLPAESITAIEIVSLNIHVDIFGITTHGNRRGRSGIRDFGDSQPCTEKIMYKIASAFGPDWGVNKLP